ncbi:MAG: hypothetical protein ABIE74_06465 [Pseudomonadota bacterium]
MNSKIIRFIFLTSLFVALLSCGSDKNADGTTTIRWMFTQVGVCTGIGLPSDSNGIYASGTCTPQEYATDDTTWTIADGPPGTTNGTWSGNNFNCIVTVIGGDTTCNSTSQFILQISDCGLCEGTLMVDYTQ